MEPPHGKRFTLLQANNNLPPGDDPNHRDSGGGAAFFQNELEMVKEQTEHERAMADLAVAIVAGLPDQQAQIVASALATDYSYLLGRGPSAARGRPPKSPRDEARRGPELSNPPGTTSSGRTMTNTTKDSRRTASTSPKKSSSGFNNPGGFNRATMSHGGSTKIAFGRSVPDHGATVVQALPAALRARTGRKSPGSVSAAETPVAEERVMLARTCPTTEEKVEILRNIFHPGERVNNTELHTNLSSAGSNSIIVPGERV